MGNAARRSWQSRGSLTFPLNRGLRLPAMGESRGSSAGQLHGECGTSSALVRASLVIMIFEITVYAQSPCPV